MCRYMDVIFARIAAKGWHDMSEDASMSDLPNPAAMHCFRCRGSGWCWCDEMPNRAGHSPTDLVIDDTKYTCPDCGGSGKMMCDVTDGPCSCGAWH